MACPECDNQWATDVCERCGWRSEKAAKKQSKFPRDGICEWRFDNGMRCRNVGRMSPSLTGEGPWYCAWHGECLQNPKHARDRETYNNWREQEEARAKICRRKPLEAEGKAAEFQAVFDGAEVVDT